MKGKGGFLPFPFKGKGYIAVPAYKGSLAGAKKYKGKLKQLGFDHQHVIKYARVWPPFLYCLQGFTRVYNGGLQPETLAD
eukprot:1136861-Pelagomonas_calceolata.AAC.1